MLGFPAMRVFAAGATGAIGRHIGFLAGPV
jgi:hypothetical protein